MNMRKNLLLTILMMLASAWLPRVLRGRPVAANSKVMDSPEDMVEQILLNCGLNPTEMQTVLRSLDFSILHCIVTDSAKTKLNRKFVNEVMHEKGQRTLPNCQSKHIFLHVSGDDSHKNQNSEYLTSLFGRDTLSRRHLVDQTNSGVLPTLDSSLAPVLVSLSSLDHSVESPSYRPPTHSTLANPSLPATFRYEFLQDSDSTMDYKTILPPEKNKNSESSLVWTVVLTAAGTSVLAILFFFCCKRSIGNKCYGDGLKDERPLLTLSTSDFSGSSQESNGLVGAIQKDKIGNIINLAGSGETPASEIPSGILTSSTNASSNDISLIPPPLPPLKPPPGRKVAFTPPPPPPLLEPKTGPPPPPAPKAAPPPPKVAPPRSSRVPRPSPLGPNHSGDTSVDAQAPKTKLKPLFWDKVSTNPEKSMVWNEIKGGSFQFDEEMIETLFGYHCVDKGKNEHKKASSSHDSPQYIILLEPKKSQNLAISLKAMGMKIDEVSNALMEGNELPVELLQTLLRMAPNTDEELRIRLYTGDPSLLGPGEQFLKTIMEIPCAFKRMDALLFMTSLEEDVSSIKESFACLEVASKELRSSRLFLKLLEAVLKLGNRMNDGTFRGGAQAFKLDTLLKLSDVKGTDGKTTLLHFVVQEIIRSEGIRAVRMAKEKKRKSNLTTLSVASDDQMDDPLEESEDHYRNLGLKVVSVLSTELENVKKAANTDADALSVAVASLGRNLVKTKEFLNTDMKSMEEESGFHKSLKSFIELAEADISLLQEEEDRVKSLVKSTADYFHGNSGKDEGLRLFIIVRDFLGMLDKACKEVRESQKKIVNVTRSKDNQTLTPISEPEQRLFPAIRDRRVDSSSSDDEESQV